MGDVHTKEQRSRNMAAIKGSGNKSTELSIIALLRKEKIYGWRKQWKNLPGKPDIVFIKNKIAIFLDGCFWHGCPKCDIKPVSNKLFWRNKIIENIERDKRKDRELKAEGWKVLHLWEHRIKKSPDKVLSQIKSLL